MYTRVSAQVLARCPLQPRDVRENVVDRYQSLPPIDETREYVRKVLRYYRTFLVRDGVITERPVSRLDRAAPAEVPAISEASFR